jgi:hypothetical protein
MPQAHYHMFGRIERNWIPNIFNFQVGITLGHKLLCIIWCVFLHENFLHMLLTLGATNFKPNKYQMTKKRIIFFATFSKWIQWPLKLLCCILFNQMHYMNISKLYKCMHYLSMKENWSQLHCLIHSFWFL